MWNHTESIEIAAPPTKIWQLFVDVAGWKNWNAGIEKIELHGPFAQGTTFAMQVPGGDTMTSTLIEVKENAGFTDETVIDDTRVQVQHKIEPLPSGGSRVVYTTTITGPAAAEFGPMVTGDFPAVLAALKSVAESQ